MTSKPDIETDRETSARLGKQRQKDTKPELLVRQLVHGLGHRYRVRNKDLAGSPDIANRSRKWAIFVHGCYWHHHEDCPRATIPKRNRDFWIDKFAANRERDERAVKVLEDDGYSVLTVWECELADIDAVERRLDHFIPQAGGAT